MTEKYLNHRVVENIHLWITKCC